MTYVTASDVYRTAGITSSEISIADVNKFILEAENDVDRVTYTTYWNVIESGTATAGASTTMTDSSQDWTVNEYAGAVLWIYGGTGSGQCRKISSNTATAITVDAAWSTNPASGSTYRIIHTGTDPLINAQVFDGTGTDTFFLDTYPLRLLQTVSINSTSVTPGYIYQYADQGKLVLKSTAEYNHWYNAVPQAISLTYWYGVYPLPVDVQRYTMLSAAVKCLNAQMGGTFDDPSTYTLPEGSVTVGQAYINIKASRDEMFKEMKEIEARLRKYVSFS